MIRRRGQKVLWADYTRFQPSLVGRFDHIVLNGSMEHLGGGNPAHRSTYARKCALVRRTFRILKRYYKPGSHKKNILASTLHINPRFKNDWQSYVVERIYGGSYFLDNATYSQAACLRDSGYEVIANRDETFSYYFASYCDKTHFGNPVANTQRILPYALVYPMALHGYVYSEYGLWMWQFDGKLHRPRDFECYNKDKIHKCDLSFEKNRRNRPTTLYWTIAKVR